MCQKRACLYDNFAFQSIRSFSISIYLNTVLQLYGMKRMSRNTGNRVHVIPQQIWIGWAVEKLCVHKFCIFEVISQVQHKFSSDTRYPIWGNRNRHNYCFRFGDIFPTLFFRHNNFLTFTFSDALYSDWFIFRSNIIPTRQNS